MVASRPRDPGGAARAGQGEPSAAICFLISYLRPPLRSQTTLPSWTSTLAGSRCRKEAGRSRKPRLWGHWKRIRASCGGWMDQTVFPRQKYHRMRGPWRQWSGTTRKAVCAARRLHYWRRSLSLAQDPQREGPAAGDGTSRERKPAAKEQHGGPWRDTPELPRIEKAKVYSPSASPRPLHLETPLATRQQPREGVFSFYTACLFALDLYLGSLHARDPRFVLRHVQTSGNSQTPLPDPLFDPRKSTSKPRP
jgi:hypothetical protein